MNLHLRPNRPVADSLPSPSAERVLWHHPAFCRIALPLRAPRAAWERTVPTALVAIEPGAAGYALPAGELLRALLLFICDAAVRSGEPVVQLGDNPAVLASRLGRRLKESAVREQVERILAAIITVSLDGGPKRALLDRRGLPHGDDGAWRAAIRLSAGFHTGLIESAIPLDRIVVETLQDAPTVLDAYNWTKQALHRREPDRAVSAKWADLHAGFANASQDRKTFERSFAEALQRVAEADPSLRLQVTPGGVCIVSATSDAGGRHDDGLGSEPAAVPPTSDATLQAKAQPGTGSPPQDAEAPEPVPRRHGKAATEARDAPAKDDHAASPPGQQARPDAPVRPASVPETVSLRSELTGLPQVIWLRRGYGADSALVGVTPGERFDADRLTLLAVEPLVVQVSGGLHAADFDTISAWILVNRDLIDDIWAGQIGSLEEISRRLRKAPPPAWR